SVRGAYHLAIEPSSIARLYQVRGACNCFASPACRRIPNFRHRAALREVGVVLSREDGVEVERSSILAAEIAQCDGRGEVTTRGSHQRIRAEGDGGGRISRRLQRRDGLGRLESGGLLRRTGSARRNRF